MKVTWLILVSCIFAFSEALACFCKGVPIEKEVEATSVIFVGVVTDISTIEVSIPFTEDHSLTGQENKVEFKLIENVKGSTGGTVTIYTGSDYMTGCGFKFEKNKNYIVFAHEREVPRQSIGSSLFTDSCTRTIEVDDEFADAAIRLIRRIEQ